MKTILACELKKELDKNEVFLIDVREPSEHRSECIEGAVLIPLHEISVESLPRTQKKVVLHCRSGRRSAAACAKLLATHPTLDLSILEGGILAWGQAGYPVKKSGSNVLPLDRQTQLVVGAIALSGTLLGSWVNPAFYVVPGLMGAGLMVAGLTGFCGMARLLSKMPWNR